MWGNVNAGKSVLAALDSKRFCRHESDGTDDILPAAAMFPLP
jgi:hypothetical protein